MFRWIKFEEDVEEGGERWSKPFVATLSLHSLFELRKAIMTGCVMLDVDANSIVDIMGWYMNNTYRIRPFQRTCPKERTLGFLSIVCAADSQQSAPADPTSV